MKSSSPVQLFDKFDLVRIAKDLGEGMNHFESDCDAIVIGSDADQYGGDDISSYTVFIEGVGEVSWYEDYQLTLIKINHKTLLKKWQRDYEDSFS